MLEQPLLAPSPHTPGLRRAAVLGLGHTLAGRVVPSASVAERLGLDEVTVERLDEQPPSAMARLAALLLVIPPEAPILPDARGVLTPDAVADATRAVILEAAERPPLIVVGHGGASLFAARPGTLHLRLVAPVEDRVRRVAGRTSWETAAAAEQARIMDRDRARYVARYYQTDWRDPLRYDLVVNTGRVEVAAVAEMVAALVAAGRGAAGRSPVG